MDPTRNPGGRLSAARFALGCGAAVILCCAWLSAGADTEVYKWIDPQGRIHYSDRPPPAEGRLLSMEAAPGSRARSAGNAPAAAPAARSGAPGASTAPAPTDAASPKQREAVANDVATVRAEQCKAATERYNNYIRAHHLYHEGPNQERIYLTEEELQTERLNARRELDEACSNQ